MPSDDLFRGTSIGRSLATVLNNMVQEGKIQEDDGSALFDTFDQAIISTLHQVPVRRNTDDDKTTIGLNGTVQSYNHYIDDWNVMLEKSEIQVGKTNFTLAPIQVQLTRYSSSSKKKQKKIK